MMSKLSFSSVFGSQWFGGALMAICLCLLSVQATTAQTYVNSGNAYYSEPGPPPLPNFDDTAFDNPNIFSVTYNLISYNQVNICQPWFGTLFYTNTGEMILNAPIPTNAAAGSFDSFTDGVTYQFDLQNETTKGHSMAGTFYNPGTIRCDSILDGNNANTLFFDQFGFFQIFGFTGLTSIGNCFVSATNIINPGTIRIGDGGQMNLNGQYVDLSSAILTLEQGFVTSNNVNVALNPFNPEGEGVNTNGYSPFFNLTATNATASAPDNLSLSFPASYFNTIQSSPTSSIVEAVFVVNANTNVPLSVFLPAPANFPNPGALLQWSGTFLDPVTGLTDTNYLYLSHFYIDSTNFLAILSTGNNPSQSGFITAYNSIWQQGTPIPGLPPPATPGFQNVFPNVIVTNLYEYFNGTLGGTTVATNSSSQNPSGALTNLPNRLVINASRELKLNRAIISGQNYMSIMATNQFDGSPGALISSPYSDISLGVTNGYPHPLVVSNLLASTIPQWGGTLNEWSTRWTGLDANSNVIDYRVMLVYADLTPAIAPQVQNLALTGNNVVISDVLNIFGSAFANAQTLTLTTNTYGTGATSPDGELDMQQVPPTGWTWPGSFPNLAWLTNNGAIQLPNYADFSSSTPVTNGIPTIPAASATNILFETGGANVSRGSTVFIGGSTYTFTNAITTAKMTSAFNVNVLVGTTFDASLSNLIAAINFGKGAGTVYTANGTLANQTVTASSLLTGIDGMTNHGFIVTANANYAGASGNNVPTSTTATNLTWAMGGYLVGGVDPIPGTTNITYSPVPYGAIINNGLLSDFGSTMWVDNFENGAVIKNGPGSFQLTAGTATFTNGLLAAGGDVSLSANSLEVSNLMLQAGRSLTLQITNFLTDDDVSNGNVWVVGSTNATGFNGLGLVLPILPNNTANAASESNNLLGTTISMLSPPPNQTVSTTWAGRDYGVSTLGYTTNNVAIGQLILNSLSPVSGFYFTGPSGSATTNAIYVDRLVLSNYMSLAWSEGTTLITNLGINNNFTIYYADAVSSSTVNGGPLEDVSYIINGFNNGHLQWVPQYVGYFSSTNMGYSGSVNRLNIGLVSDPYLDSNGSGIPNTESSDPVFVGSQIAFKQVRVSNSLEKLTWNSVPGATNYVLYATTNWANWNVYTNFVSPSSSATWPITNIIDVPIPLNRNSSNCWLRVRIDQDNSVLYGQ